MHLACSHLITPRRMSSLASWSVGIEASGSTVCFRRSSARSGFDQSCAILGLLPRVIALEVRQVVEHVLLRPDDDDAVPAAERYAELDVAPAAARRHLERLREVDDRV